MPEHLIEERRNSDPRRPSLSTVKETIRGEEIESFLITSPSRSPAQTVRPSYNVPDGQQQGLGMQPRQNYSMI